MLRRVPSKSPTTTPRVVTVPVAGRRRSSSLDLVDRRERGVTRRGIVVLDRPGRLAVGDVRAHDIRDGDEERLVGLERRVAVHRHAERVRTRTTGRDHLTGERLRHVVRILFGTAGVLGGSVGGGDVERDPSVAGRRGERDIEDQGRRAVVALDGRGVPDRQSGHGHAPHGSGGAAVLRGLGAAAAKSELLLSVSMQPLPARKSAVVVEGVGAGPAPSKKLAAAVADQIDDLRQLRGRTRRARTVARQASGRVRQDHLAGAARHVDRAGRVRRRERAAVGAARRLLHEVVLAGREGSARGLSWLAPNGPVPVALAYCTDHPSSETVVVPRLNNSM